jgi:hypothetical protein
MSRIVVTAVFVTLSLALGTASANGVNQHNQRITGTDLQPFSHFAQIPADADVNSIRFENVKTVEVPARITATSDTKYCEELAFREPGGSMYCPYTETATTMAYAVTYSYIGEPMGSDETGNRHFAFQVYYRPDELSPEMRKALSAGKLSRADKAAYFAVNTDRESVRQTVIDEEQSQFCRGNYVDGAWVQNDADCQDAVTYKAAAVPSDYVTVRVEPVLRSSEGSADRSAPGR